MSPHKRDGRSSDISEMERENPTSTEMRQEAESVWRAARDGMGQTAQHARDAMRGTTEQVKHAANIAAEQMRHSAQHYYEAGLERAREAEQRMEGRIRQKPLIALSIAAGFGFLIGLMCNRR